MEEAGDLACTAQLRRRAACEVDAFKGRLFQELQRSVHEEEDNTVKLGQMGSARRNARCRHVILGHRRPAMNEIEELKRNIDELHMMCDVLAMEGSPELLKEVTKLVVAAERQLLKARLSMLEQRDIKL